MTTTKEQLDSLTKLQKTRFHELHLEREDIAAKSEPLREQYDAMVARHTAEMAPLVAQIKAIEVPLFALDQERAKLAVTLQDADGKSRMGKSADHLSADAHARLQAHLARKSAKAG